MQKEINFYQEVASEHRLQEYSKGPVPLFVVCREFLTFDTYLLNLSHQI